MLGTPTSGTQDFALAPHQCVLCPQTLSENISLPGMFSQQTIPRLHRALRVRQYDEGRDVWLFLLFLSGLILVGPTPCEGRWWLLPYPLRGAHRTGVGAST